MMLPMSRAARCYEEGGHHISSGATTSSRNLDGTDENALEAARLSVQHADLCLVNCLLLDRME